jgi:hypothetical protein
MKRGEPCHGIYRLFRLGARNVGGLSRDRRNVEQGSAERGAGARLRDATVESIVGASGVCRSHARLRGQIPGKSSGPLFRPATRPACGMRPWSRSLARLAYADPTGVSGVRSPEIHRGPSSALRQSSSAPRRAPFFWGCDPGGVQAADAPVHAFLTSCRRPRGAVTRPAPGVARWSASSCARRSRSRSPTRHSIRTARTASPAACSRT